MEKEGVRRTCWYGATHLQLSAAPQCFVSVGEKMRAEIGNWEHRVWGEIAMVFVTCFLSARVTAKRVRNHAVGRKEKQQKDLHLRSPLKRQVILCHFA